ncbi:MAG: hypothetical protein M1838_004739 [Thelocarpon superellum]|nr:MAG: hypothetical protein M1838_004739 [Thelocarpon superellum]
MWNAGSLAATWAVGWLVGMSPFGHDSMAMVLSYLAYPVLLLRLVLCYNIAAALAPLARRKDDLSDIPLTPPQRALLGLDPRASSPVTPGSTYITPPRYHRSSTPGSGTPGSRASSYGSSPLSGKGSPANAASPGGSPYSPMASPLLQKAVAGGSRDLTRRNSYASPSPLGANATGNNASVMGLPATPSPSSGKRASVGLNSRWLYERGRASPGSPALYS